MKTCRFFFPRFVSHIRRLEKISFGFRLIVHISRKDADDAKIMQKLWNVAAAKIPVFSFFFSAFFAPLRETFISDNVYYTLLLQETYRIYFDDEFLCVRMRISDRC
ncbi:MAG: hypothetical protein BWK80_01075 [Desulfobacteraceae bacterium IS3]|nr:MAG: hypothetical protein BWK80_01075 [Desulfobacteraceae bacterium IS3]